jgi:hypothetical protein
VGFGSKPIKGVFMSQWLPVVLSSVASVLTSSGFWAYVQHKDQTKAATTRLMMGLAYSQITKLGVSYIERGYITQDEYEEYLKYYFEPYKALGGNGVAERIATEVSTLPIRSDSAYSDLFRNRARERFINNVRVVSRPVQQEAPAE